jgi:hypothetical protein
MARHVHLTQLQLEAPLGRSAAYLLSLALPASVLSALSLIGCSMTPYPPQRPPTSKEDTRFAEQSAYAGQDRRDGFTIPEATGVDDAGSIRSQTVATKALRSASVRIGLVELSFGEHPPYSTEQTKLPAPPSLAKPGAELLSPAMAKPELPQPWVLTRTILVGEGSLHKAQLTPDNGGVVTLSNDSGTIYHYSIATGRLINKITLPQFAQSEDADFVVIKELSERPQVVVSRESGTMALDLMSGRLDALEDIPPGNDVAESGVLGLYGTSLRRVNPQAGDLSFHWLDGTASLRAHCVERPDDWSLSTDGTWLALTYFPSNTAQVIDLQKRELLHELPMPSSGSSVALSPDTSLLAVGGDHLELIRLSDGKRIAEDRSYQNNITDIQFSPAGDLLLVSAHDGKVRSYALPLDLTTLTLLPKPQLLDHLRMSKVYEFGLSADGRLLVTSSGDKTLKIWKR